MGISGWEAGRPDSTGTMNAAASSRTTEHDPDDPHSLMTDDRQRPWGSGAADYGWESLAGEPLRSGDGAIYQLSASVQMTRPACV